MSASLGDVGRTSRLTVATPTPVVGGLPIVNHMLDRLGLPALIAGALPPEDARVKLAPAVAIRLGATNVVVSREPLYGLGEWAVRCDPAQCRGVLHRREPGRGGVPRPQRLRIIPLPEPAPRVRAWPALLPRCAPRPAADAGAVCRGARADRGDQLRRRAGLPALQLPAWRQRLPVCWRGRRRS